MNNDLWLLITIVRKEDMEMLRYVHNTNRDTYLGQNYQYWNETDVAKEYLEIFDFDEDVVVLNVEELNGVR
jgi:hypothetical protein